MIHITLMGVALLHMALALFVLTARRQTVVNRAFAAQSLVFAGWIIGIAGLQTGVNLDLWFGFAFAFASLIPVAFLIFSCCYPTATSWSSPLHARVALVVGTMFMLLALTTDSIVYGAVIGPAGLSRKTGPLYPAFAV